MFWFIYRKPQDFKLRFWNQYFDYEKMKRATALHPPQDASE